MGKVKTFKPKKINTYSKKCGSKLPEKKQSVSINVNVTNYINVTNVTNNYYICLNKSSEDEFDKLKKGPTYNIPKEPSLSGSSACGKWFYKRQNTLSLYNSDATPNSISSVHLFKDITGELSDRYSPNELKTPPSYRKEKKRLVLQPCRQKNKNRVYKKKVKRIIKSEKPPINRVKTITAASSTPNHPMSSQIEVWTESHVSPIVPYRKPYNNTLNSSSQDLFDPQENNEEKNVSPKQAPNVSVLVHCFDNLQLSTTPKGIKNFDKEQKSNKDLCGKTNKLNSSGLPNESIVSFRCFSNVYKRRTTHIDKEFKSKEVHHAKEEIKGIEKGKINSTEVVCISPGTKQEVSCDIITRQSLMESPSKNANMSQAQENKDEEYNKNISLNIIKRPNNTPSNQVPLISEVSVVDQEEPRCSLTHLENEIPVLIHEKEILGCDSPKIKLDVALSNTTKITESENNHSQKDITEVRPSSLLTITAGSKWRRSLIQQIKTDPFKRSIQSGVLVQILKKSDVLIKSRHSCNPATVSGSQLTDFIRRNTYGANAMGMFTNRLDFNSSVELFKSITKRKKQIENRNMLNLKFDSITEENLSQENGSFSSDEKNISKDETKLVSVTENILKETNDTNEISFRVETQKTKLNKAELTDLNISTSEIEESTPPILKMDLESVLQTVTKRKKEYFTPGPCYNLDVCEVSNADSSYSHTADLSDPDIVGEELEQSGSPISEDIKEENLSCFIENDPEELNQMAKVGFLHQCGHDEPVPFNEAFPDSLLDKCCKIGEGVYGEVFMLNRSPKQKSVLKIIPVEGSQIMNGTSQKRYEEVLSELIISEELSSLRYNYSSFCTSGFCELKNKFWLQGQYPAMLIQLWHDFGKTSESENDCPDVFGPDQLYLAVELDHAGEPVETYRFSTAQEAYSVFLQTTFSLAVAEACLEFEHRDLHVGNVLVKATKEEYVSFIQNGQSFQVPTFGAQATIIDFTLSRMSFQDDVLFFDMEKDPELFTAEGDFQFDIYRIMRDEVKKNWLAHKPKTNIWWLYYFIDKLITKGRYDKRKVKKHTEYLKKLEAMKPKVSEFMSSSDFADFLLNTLIETVEIIKNIE